MTTQLLLDHLIKTYSLDKDWVEEEMTDWKPETTSLRQFFIAKSLLNEQQFQRALADFLQIKFHEKLQSLPPEKMAHFVEKVPSRFLYKGMFFPIAWDQKSITFAVTELASQKVCEQVAESFFAESKLALALENSIVELIQKEYKLGEAEKKLLAEEDGLGLSRSVYGEGEDLLEQDEEEPIRRLVNAILFQALNTNSSDVHIDATAGDSIVRNRLDGQLMPVSTIASALHQRVINRVKVMSGLDISVRNLPQDGRALLKIGGKKVDVRVSILPTIHGERVVMRLLQQSYNILKLGELGLYPKLEQQLNEIVQKPNGMILVTGPTGSGKTTTLYACLQAVDHESRNVITVEDPVEYQVAGYGQVQVNEKQGLTFAVGLRSILRQDPDVIMVGEIRDAITAQIAIQSALTGHLVLSTLHTNSATATIIRLIDMEIEPFLVSSTLQAVLAQRLVRRLCSFCKVKTETPWSALAEIGAPSKLKKLYSGHVWEEKGCVECAGMGFKGRIAVHELLVINEALQSAITQKTTSSFLLRTAEESNSIVTLAEDGFSKVLDGLVSLSEIKKVLYEVENA